MMKCPRLKKNLQVVVMLAIYNLNLPLIRVTVTAAMILAI